MAALTGLALFAVVIALGWRASAAGHAQGPTPIPGGPELTVDISGPPPLFTPVAPSQPLTIVIVAHNLGDAAANPVKVLGWPVGIFGATIQTTQGSCTLTPDNPLDMFRNRLVCDLGTLSPPGGPGASSATITVSGHAPQSTGRAPGLGVIVDNAVTVDPDSNVAESNEENNTVDVKYFLVNPLPTSTPLPRPPARDLSAVALCSTTGGYAAGKRGTVRNGLGETSPGPRLWRADKKKKKKNVRRRRSR